MFAGTISQMAGCVSCSVTVMGWEGGGMMLYIVKWFKCVNTPVCFVHATVYPTVWF